MSPARYDAGDFSDFEGGAVYLRKVYVALPDGTEAEGVIDDRHFEGGLYTRGR